MTIRDKLKYLYKHIDDIKSDISTITTDYINDLGGDKGIYISDHAIVRYLERIENYSFNKGFTDSEKLNSYPGYIKDIRDIMLTLEEDRKILLNQKPFFNRGKYSYIIKELTVVTVLLN